MEQIWGALAILTRKGTINLQIVKGNAKPLVSKSQSTSIYAPQCLFELTYQYAIQQPDRGCNF